jgi:subtilisin family serine protease
MIESQATSHKLNISSRRVTILSTVILLALGYMAYDRQPAAWALKVDPWVLNATSGSASTEFLIFLVEQADLSGTATIPTREAKGAYVYARLTAVAQRSQPPIIAALNESGAEYRPFWIANAIWVRGDAAVVQAMARRPDVAHLYANPAVALDEPVAANMATRPQATSGVEWNIALVNAPAVWAEGYTGQGVVIGGQDTGYDWEHPALIDQYRGWNGATADHHYNWHDAIHSGGGSCGPNSPEPCDDHFTSHGTHTIGTMVGDDGAGNQVGMAPGASWIGCRNMDQGAGTPATYMECYQWFLAPTDLNNQNPDPTRAPHVINNSWSCPPDEGCTDPDLLRAIVENVRAAGIITVHAAGNSGPGCSTVNTPAAIYDASFSVGATTSTDAIAIFSSRGPVTIDGSGRLKPDISAPGSSVRSTIRGGNYGLASGTSMAAPHVAGLVALLVSAQPELAGQVDTIESIIRQAAVPLTMATGCGGDTPTSVPNHTFGYGRIDALHAYQLLLLDYRTYLPILVKDSVE